MIRPQIAINQRSQFPTLLQTTSPAMKAIKLSAGLGVVTFEGPFGRRCVLFLANDVRAESIFQRLTEATLGDPGMPWSWEGYPPYR